MSRPKIKNPNMVVAFSGPTAVGKNSILKYFLSKPGSTTRVAHTTRSPRPGEVDGAHYHFVSFEEFERRVARGEFLEHALVHKKNYYGTSRLSIVEAISTRKDVFLDLDVQGARQLKVEMSETIDILVIPPSYAELRRRLFAREDGMSETEKLERLETSVEELGRAHEFSYIVVNDDLDLAIHEVMVLLGILTVDGRPSADRFKNMARVDRLLVEAGA